MDIQRYYDGRIEENLKSGKVLVVYGPRRTGKTTMIKKFAEKFSGKYFYEIGEDRELRELLESESVAKITGFFSRFDLVIIDEAQMIQKIGTGLKILVDRVPGIKVIASGSSSFDLSNKIGEPLTGRKNTVTLFPVSMIEASDFIGDFEIQRRIEEFLIYGTYPEVFTENSYEGKKILLEELRNSYLFKDILALENVKNPRKLLDLLMLISFQIGKEVSLTELGNSLDLAKQTVERYLDLLEKTFIIKKVGGFSRNLRKEVTKSSRYYFLDNGVLNSVTNNFKPLNLRNDAGQLWENFLFTERLKKQAYHRIYSNNYFWRTYDMQEIDLVEERDGKLYGFEFKLNPKKIKAPRSWSENYPESEFLQVNKDNYLGFIT